MNGRQLLLRNVRHYWRTNLAILLGVVVGTAVITGALVVGDSVRASLRSLTLARLGQVDHALTGRRFFREAIVDALKQRPELKDSQDVIAPLLILNGGLQFTPPAIPGNSDPATVRVNRVQIYAVDERAWNLLEHGAASPPQGDEILVNRRVAGQLGVSSNSNLTLNVSLPAAVPRDSLLGKKDSTTTQVPFRVREVLDERLGVSRLGLQPDQQLPLNVFVSLTTLQSALELQQQHPSRTLPQGRAARVNSLFIHSVDNAHSAHWFQERLREVLTLEDLDLRLKPHPEQHYFACESAGMILPPNLATVAMNIAPRHQLSPTPVLVYLANQLRSKQGTTTYSMYSTVAGVPLEQPGLFPPAAFASPSPSSPILDDEILLNEWLAKDLQSRVGDSVDLTYYVAGSRGELPELTQSFKVRGLLKLDGTRASDRGFVPEVKGITDAKTLNDWDQPFSMRFDLITKRDEDYWEKYRATPKAFVTLATAQKLWKTRYGELTSILLTPPAGTPLPAAQQAFATDLLSSISLPDLGLQIQPVKQHGLQAAAGTTDFAGLFFGFSLFLILSAAILVGLLYRLGIDQRLAEIGLLRGIGFPPRRIRNLLLLEGGIALATGTLVGSLAGILYAQLMLYGLTTWWIGAIRTRELLLDIRPASLLTGAGISLFVALLSIVTSLRRLHPLSVRQLLGGRIEVQTSAAQRQRQTTRAGWGALLFIGTALGLIAVNLLQLLPKSPAPGGMSWSVLTFFPAGMLFLVGGQFILKWWLLNDRQLAVQGAGQLALARLGLRNGARSPSRTTLSVSLLACATFLVVAVAAGQRNPARELPDRNSGNGGFTLVAEADAPLLFDLNTPAGRLKFGLSDPQSTQLLDKTTIVPFRYRQGDNASCLNLFQTRLPTILGVPRQMRERGGFRFVNATDTEAWKLLDQTLPDGSIPVLGDMNTLMFSMHKGVGEQIPIDPADPKRGALQISGMFDGSVFQGVLLMSEEHFLQIFPDQAGFRYFLLDTPLDRITPVTELLESRLSPFGFDAERVADRLADFLAVQNTYLSTFQTLGGLGLLLGTLGLAAVMLRNVLERRSEFSLLLAVGYRTTHISALVLWETLALLLYGIVVGTLSALLSMLPHISSVGADVPWISGAGTLLLILATGLLSATIPLRTLRRIPLLETLRSEST